MIEAVLRGRSVEDVADTYEISKELIESWVEQDHLEKEIKKFRLEQVSDNY